jgi:trehalose 6-phosphate synthase
MIKQRVPNARVAIFWHIPWPNADAFSICPWQHELLDGLLGADLIGFHVQAHCNNFLNTIDRVLEARVDWEHFSVRRKSHWSSVLPFPISVDFVETNRVSADIDLADERSALLTELGVEATFLGVGVDRLDYTKGIIERFLAVELFSKDTHGTRKSSPSFKSGRPREAIFSDTQTFKGRLRMKSPASTNDSGEANGGLLSC